MSADDGKEAWRSATHNALNQTKDLAQRVVQAVQDLEQDEADRMAAQKAAQDRARRRAALLAKRKKEEEARMALEAFKAQQAEEMRLQKELMAKSKADASAAVKAATANFKAAGEAEAAAKDKAIQMSDLTYAKKMLLSGVHACQRESRMNFAVLKVCEMRAEMRAERPETEMFRDAVDESLDVEKRELNAARDELSRYVQDGVKVVKEIDETKELLTTGPSRDNVIRRKGLQQSSSLPALVASPNASNSMGSHSMLNDTASTADLLKKSKQIVPHALRLGEVCHDCVADRSEKCAIVAGETNKCLDQRKAELDELIKHLEKQKAEVSSTIADAERRLRDLKMRAARGVVTPEQRAAVQAAESSILQLKDSKRHLEEDWRLKTAAFKIDESCRILTKVRAGAHASGSPPSSPVATGSPMLPGV